LVQHSGFGAVERTVLWGKRENGLPGEDRKSDAHGWLSDRIVSVTRGADADRDGARIRLHSQDPFFRLQFVSIYVRDQDRSLRFYVEQLGFRLISDVRFASGNRWIEVSPPDGTASLALMLADPANPYDRQPGESGPVTFVTEDIQAKYKELCARGVTFTVPLQVPAWGGTFCRFEDPDGNPFVIAGFDEITREVETRRREFAARQEAERRAAQELEIATQVQARLFPHRRPPVPGLDYAGVCIQARSVGGDYYDFLDLGTGRVALVVADIAGKGIAAALLMANLQANLRSQCVHAVEHPGGVLNLVNRLVYENTDAHAYATLFLAEFDHRDGSLRYANCGHLPALLLREDGSVERLEATCTVIGMFDEWQCTLAETRIRPGDLLALHTDGLTESPNADGEEFGEERLIEALRRHGGLRAEDLVGEVVADVRRFSTGGQYDDITLIAARREA
jgi:serine phosphatase RsbU (regulator of sigma subunit)/catechol 2,3-dioxygenase-like lactoylglutathione lyase family enzyme